LHLSGFRNTVPAPDRQAKEQKNRNQQQFIHYSSIGYPGNLILFAPTDKAAVREESKGLGMKHQAVIRFGLHLDFQVKVSGSLLFNSLILSSKP